MTHPVRQARRYSVALLLAATIVSWLSDPAFRRAVINLLEHFAGE